MRQILRSDNLPGPKFRYSPCVKVGPIYQMAGMIGLDPKEGALVKGGVETETTQILANLQNALPDFGLSWNDLFQATIFTTKFDEFALINRAWERVFDETNLPPARTAVGVTALPLFAAVEIEFRFYKED